MKGQPISDRAIKPGITAKVGDPTEYSDDEREFMVAVEKYRREHNRPFPTCSEILAIAKSLGYRKDKA